MTTSQ